MKLQTIRMTTIQLFGTGRDSVTIAMHDGIGTIQQFYPKLGCMSSIRASDLNVDDFEVAVMKFGGSEVFLSVEKCKMLAKVLTKHIIDQQKLEDDYMIAQTVYLVLEEDYEKEESSEVYNSDKFTEWVNQRIFCSDFKQRLWLLQNQANQFMIKIMQFIISHSASSW